MDPATIPVKVEGLSPSAYILGLILITIIGALIKSWPALKKIAAEGDASLRHDLMDRITNLEANAQTERERFKVEIQAERDRCAAMEVEWKAEVAGLHGQIHELRNIMVELTLKAGK